MLSLKADGRNHKGTFGSTKAGTVLNDILLVWMMLSCSARFAVSLTDGLFVART